MRFDKVEVVDVLGLSMANLGSIGYTGKSLKRVFFLVILVVLGGRIDVLMILGTVLGYKQV